MDNQYKISSRQQSILIAGMGLGVLCLILTYLVPSFDPTGELKSRFWSNLLHNSVFFTGISLMALFFFAVCVTAWAGWHTLFKRIWEAMSQFLIIGLVLMLLMGVALWLNWHHLYHWADAASVESDYILESKSGFLNKGVYLIFGTIIVAVWYFFARKIRSISLDEDKNGGDPEFKHHYKLRFWSAVFLPVAGFSSAAIVWLWVMSVDAHWYSTLFAWYAGASWFVSMIALTLLVLIYLKGKGYFPKLSVEHMHDLGKFLFAFSIFWTYLWFSQYMLIWYGNVGEETGYFKHRLDHYPILFYGNLLINFVLPFLVLLRNDTKRKLGTLALTAGFVLFGHWIDYFLMLKPGILHTAHALSGHGGHGHGDHGHGAADAAAHGAGHGAEHGVAEAAHHGASEFLMGFHLPGFLELGTAIGFLCLFLFVFYRALASASLTPKNDPFLKESYHHHV